MAQPISVSYTTEFLWISPDLAVMGALLESACAGYLPPSRISLTCTLEGSPRQEKTFASVADFVESGSEANRGRAFLTGNSNANTANFSWDQTAGSFLLTVTAKGGPDAEAETAALRQLFVSRLGLRPQSKSNAELTFRAPSATESFAPLISMAEEMTGSGARFRGTWKGQDGAAKETASRQEWAKEAIQSARWSGSWERAGQRFYVNYEGQYSSLRVELQSWDASSLPELGQRIKALPGLLPSTARPEKSGEMRRYFLSGEATADWYQRALSILVPFVKDESAAPWGRVRRGEPNKSTRGYGDSGAWQQAVQIAIAAGDIEQSYISWFGSERSLTFDLDHVRDLLQIDVQSSRPAEVDKLHSELVKELDLKPAPENAYRDRRWGRIYRIRLSDPKEFSAQLEQAVKVAFDGRRTLLTVGTLHLGGNEEEVKTFTELSALLDALQSLKDLTEFHISLTGPKGDFIGVNVDQNLSRLRLIASMPIKEFNAFASALKDGLGSMELSGVDNVGPANGTVQEKKPGASSLLPWLTLLVGAIGALGGSKAIEVLREPPEVIIDRPALTNGMAQTQARDVTISWTVKQPRKIGPSALDGRHEALVTVTRLRDNHDLLQNARETGNVQLNGLDDGSYYAKIDAGNSYKTVIFTVKGDTEDTVQTQQSPRPPHRAASTNGRQ